MVMSNRKSPQVIIFDGATGSGKSSLLKYLRQEYSHSVLVGTKLTTRQRRLADNDWEFRFVDHIPHEYRSHCYNSLGMSYAVDYPSLVAAVREGLVYAFTCVDRVLIERIKFQFNTLAIYVYRSWTMGELEQLLVERGPADPTTRQLRLAEVAAVAQSYGDNVDLYDHVILNLASEADLHKQFNKLMASYDLGPSLGRPERTP